MKTLPAHRVCLSLVALCLLGGAEGSLAQQPLPSAVVATTTPSPNLAGIAHVALRVHDLNVAVAFYEKLGFVKAFELSREGQVYEAFIKINDRQFIELYPATASTPQIGFLHVCFEGGSLPSVHDFYVSQGLKPTDVRTAGAGNLLFTMHGPPTPTGDQNLEYTQYMPGSLHSKDFGQHLGTSRIATTITSVAIAVADPAAARSFYLEKLGFVPAAEDTLAIPGAGSQQVVLVPAQALQFRSRITLRVKDLGNATTALKHLSIPYTPGKTSLTLTDPDGNELLLTPPA